MNEVSASRPLMDSSAFDETNIVGDSLDDTATILNVDDMAEGERFFFMDGNAYEIVSQPTPSGYSTNASGMLEISDAVFPNNPSSIPNAATAANNQTQISELAFKISKMETLLLKLVHTTDKIWKAMQSGSADIIVPNSEASAGASTYLITASAIDNENDQFKKINTVEQLIEFEQKLKSTQFKNRMVRIYLFRLIRHSSTYLSVYMIYY